MRSLRFFRRGRFEDSFALRDKFPPSFFGYDDPRLNCGVRCWPLGHYEYKRETKMKNRCREFGELSLANRLAGCVKIDINCAALRPTHVRRGNRTASNQKRKPPMKAKSSRSDSLVARCYPAVYCFASRLTDDPREAVLLTHYAFNSTRKQLRIRRDEVALVIILLNAVIRAGLAAA
jgi:hypothetical protein